MKINLRQLDMLLRFYDGQKLSLQDVQEYYDTSERSAYRDIKDIRDMLLEHHIGTLDFDEVKKVYQLNKQIPTQFTLADVVAMIKMLLHNRSLSLEEIQALSDKLFCQLDDTDKKMAKFVVENELRHYEPLHHGKDILPLVSQFCHYIYHHKEIAFDYIRSDNELVSRVNHPVSLFFSEMYFYVMFYSEALNVHVSYRLDRFVGDIRPTGKKIIDKHKELEDFQYIKKSHYMLTQANRSSRITFKYWENPNIPLDVFPNSRIVKEKQHTDDYTLIEITAFEYGAKKWFLGQGSLAEVIKPETFRKKIMEEIKKMNERYSSH